MTRIRSLAAVALAVALAGSTPADARPLKNGGFTPPADSPVATAAALPTWQVDGVVWRQAQLGPVVIVVGDFTAMRPPGASAGDPRSIPAAGMAAYDIRTGEPVRTFIHQLDSPGYAVDVSADGSRVYVGGDFTSVDGTPRGRVAAFTAAGALDATFRPDVNGRVRAIDTVGSKVVVGGGFSRVGGWPRQNLAALDRRSGSVLPWRASANNSVWTVLVAPGERSVVVGGQFTRLAGVSAPGMGAVSVADASAVPWPANRVIRSHTNGAVTSLRSDGVNVFGTSFAFGPGGSFEGPFSTTAAGDLRWAADCLGDTYDTAPTDEALYVVGHSHDCSAVGSFGESTPVRWKRWYRALAMTKDARTVNTGPTAHGWSVAGVPAPAMFPDPAATGVRSAQFWPELGMGTVTGQGQAAWTVSAWGPYVALGGEFPTVNGRPQAGLTRFASRASSSRSQPPTWQTRPARVVTPPQVRDNGDGTVTVTSQGAVDRDDDTLSYDLLADGVPLADSGRTVATRPWDPASVTWTVPGSVSSRWTVRVMDASGSTLLSSGSRAAEVGGGEPADEPEPSIDPAAAFPGPGEPVLLGR